MLRPLTIFAIETLLLVDELIEKAAAETALAEVELVFFDLL